MNTLHRILNLHRWRIAQGLWIALLLAGAWSILVHPKIQEWRQVAQERTDLANSMDSLGQISHRVDSLQKSLHILRTLKSQVSRPTSAAPSIDTLRRSAESNGLEVVDMQEQVQAPAGFAQANQMDLQGPCDKLALWISSLALYAPSVQIAELHWTTTGLSDHCRINGLVLAQKADPTRWLERARDKTSDPKAPTTIPNIFQGPIAHVVNISKPVHSSQESPKPVALPPAPDLRVVGLVAERLATVTTSNGKRQFLRIGDHIGDWWVVSITAEELVLSYRDIERKVYRAR